MIPVIGLLGGIGSGKSTVARILNEDCGCGLIDGDKLAHQVINMDEIVDQMHCRWKKTHGEVLKSEDYDYSLNPPRDTKRVDRKKVADIVFKDAKELKFLEGIMYPLMNKLLDEKISRYCEVYTPAIVLDAPLLLEAGWGSKCRELWYIDTPLSARMRYAGLSVSRTSLSPEEFAIREAQQINPAEKLARSDLSIPNNGNFDDLRQETMRTWKGFQEERSHWPIG